MKGVNDEHTVKSKLSFRRKVFSIDWLPKVLTQKGDFLGFEFCRSRGSFATVPAMESRFLRCSSVADIHLSTLRSDQAECVP
jgi:hypothetical protein